MTSWRNILSELGLHSTSFHLCSEKTVVQGFSGLLDLVIQSSLVYISDNCQQILIWGTFISKSWIPDFSYHAQNIFDVEFLTLFIRFVNVFAVITKNYFAANFWRFLTRNGSTKSHFESVLVLCSDFKFLDTRRSANDFRRSFELPWKWIWMWQQQMFSSTA